MKRSRAITFLCSALATAVLSMAALAQQQNRINLEHSDQMEILQEDGKLVTYVVGNVVFQTESGTITCDTAIWRRAENVHLKGRVRIYDRDFRLLADSVLYDINTKVAISRGDTVEVWSYTDSMYAVGPYVYFDRDRQYTFMDERPLVILNYEDTLNEVRIRGDTVEHDGEAEFALALGQAEISSQDMTSTADTAEANMADGVITLRGSPVVKRGRSTISGGLIHIYYSGQALDSIDVIDSANGEFVESVDTAETWFDRSILRGRNLKLYFIDGELSEVLCWSQAYSWYYPTTRGSREFHENAVSGDTIRFMIQDNQLQTVTVIGGAVGTYTSGELVAAPLPGDTTGAEMRLPPIMVDTIDYQSHRIDYRLADSTIVLEGTAAVQSGTVSLKAHDVQLDTRQRIVEAFSAKVTTGSDSLVEDPYELKLRLQPNSIPVQLQDGNELLLGDYLEYSIDTKKGRIIQSKSDYDKGFYYGERFYKEQERIFYGCQGRFTTCDSANPHWHFHSSNLKLIEGEKLIAKPVVFYLGRLPLLALPYYVFPLQTGRRSGFLTFSFGNFERGERFVRDVGYYWAPSDYWDWLGSFDYFENDQRLLFRSAVNFHKLYVIKGSVQGSYTRETDYLRSSAQEIKKSRWTFNATYDHQITPTLKLGGYGSFVSDATYYDDFSNNLNDRLNGRNLTSRLNFTKRYGSNTSLSGEFYHYVDLVRESRRDKLPEVSLSLPVIKPFGEGYKDENGNLVQSWYHGLSLTYRPSLLNYSDRNTAKEAFVARVDSIPVVDPGSGDTTSWNVTQVYDTLKTRQYKRYSKVSHNPGINLPKIDLFKHINVRPSFRYSETWIKIWDTDQSRAAGIHTDRLYRTYSYSASVGVNTALYGTVYPNVFGWTGFRHTMTPSFTYSWSPEIDMFPKERSFAGGGASSRKSSRVTVGLDHLFSAKFRRGEVERTLDLLSVRSSFSYDFEEDETPLSPLTTTITSSALPRLNLTVGLTQPFYAPNSSDPLFYVSRFSFDTRFTGLSGKTFFFDDPIHGSASGDGPRPASGGRGWSLSAHYNYSQSGKGATFRKTSHYIEFNTKFYLTPLTDVTWSQRYDLLTHRTLNISINISRQLHCWTGSLYFVPTGTNRGFGFKLFVTALPEIKIDNSHDSYVQRLQGGMF
jgi:lipopolysaccharide assembly outer membrane protein LptD (OstA)